MSIADLRCRLTGGPRPKIVHPLARWEFRARAERTDGIDRTYRSTLEMRSRGCGEDRLHTSPVLDLITEGLLRELKPASMHELFGPSNGSLWGDAQRVQARHGSVILLRKPHKYPTFLGHGGPICSLRPLRGPDRGGHQLVPRRQLAQVEADWGFGRKASHSHVRMCESAKDHLEFRHASASA